MQLNLRVPLSIPILLLSVSTLAAQAVSNSPPSGLASVESFSSIADTAAGLEQSLFHDLPAAGLVH